MSKIPADRWNRACRLIPAWPPEWLLGYRTLSEQEAKYGVVAVEAYPGAFERMFQLLALLDDALRREHDFGPGETDEVAAHVLRIRLLTVATGTAKVVLDCALSGYYVQGSALVRHMLETWQHLAYLRLYPADARRWYEDRPRIPGRKTVNAALVGWKSLKDLAITVETVRKILDNAAHPSRVTLNQIVTGRAGRRQIGANYVEESCRALLGHATLAMHLLLAEAERDVPLGDAWRKRRADLVEACGVAWAMPAYDQQSVKRGLNERRESS